MPKTVTDIALDLSCGRFAATGHYNGMRYHIWLDAQLKPESGVIFQNPISTPDHRHRTRYMSQSKGMGKIVAKALLEAAPALLPACMAKSEAEAAAKAAEHRAAVALNLAKANGPELLAMLQHVIHWHDQLKPEDIAKAKTLIAKATGAEA